MASKQKAPRQGFATVWRVHKEKYLLMAPFVLLFIVFTFVPVVVSLVLSLTDFNMFQTPNWVGLSNYINLFAFDDVFWIALRNTLVLAVITGPVSYLLCFVFAWIINELPNKFRAVMTLVFYAPSISGNTFLLWALFFSSDMHGFFNAYAMNWGFINEPILWFQTEEYIMPILILVQLWMSIGVSFLAFIAGFQNVDKSLYESGSVDGIRNRWQELWYITLPSMKPQLMFGAVMQITASLSIAAISIELMGFPTVNYAGHTILTHLHDYGTLRYEMGYASAIATVLFFMMMFTNILVQKLLRRMNG